VLGEPLAEWRVYSFDPLPGRKPHYSACSDRIFHFRCRAVRAITRLLLSDTPFPLPGPSTPLWGACCSLMRQSDFHCARPVIATVWFYFRLRRLIVFRFHPRAISIPFPDGFHLPLPFRIDVVTVGRYDVLLPP